MEPILTHTFNYSRVVTCGYCMGAGKRDIGCGLDTCAYCNGTGQLLDVRRGTMNLYPISDEKGE